MELKELEELKHKMYKDASNDGSIAKLYKIGRYLGEYLNSRHPPKYRLIKDGFNLYIDDNGGYMTLNKDGKEILSTHYCDKLYIKGHCESFIEEHYKKALEIEQNGLQEAYNKKVEKMKNELLIK